MVQLEGRTGSIVVMVDAGGERSFLTDRGASVDLADVDSRAVLKGIDWLHLPWYSLHHGAIAETCTQLAAVARSSGLPISIDASSAALLESRDGARFHEWVRAMRPRMVLCNSDEAAMLAVDAEGFGVAGAEATFVRRGGTEVVVLRPDHDPERVSLGTGAGEIVDTTGAGDAFAAGVIAGALRGDDDVSAVLAGHHAARAVIAVVGADERSTRPASARGGEA